ncbi:ABC transporter permease [Desulfolutivibrio sulfoxidireducens]|uniref:ABC transporter permease n=1 Tax=Desulfolutivibrio sulfoxidireducens TaxID=2773299 RepID=UPI00159D10E2|nr:FtsX-like permease family protein [Desulfolutivibrio sulfoxidireducens]QLA20858.1 FtsX-like permease family protein [Desulfolutivibrio sulfoxidireducens]
MELLKDMALAARLAKRELRGGFSGMRVFLACLALGVAAVCGVLSLAAGLRAGLAADAAVLLGGDVEVTASSLPLEAAPRRILERSGRVSRTLSMRAMVTAANDAGGPARRRGLVSLRAVDGSYPLLGRVELAPDMPLSEALAVRDGIPGAAAAPELLSRLSLTVGDRVRLGGGVYEIRAVLVREPDRMVSFWGFGPRFLVSMDGLAATGLVRPGSLIRYAYRVALAPGVTHKALSGELEAAFPGHGWRVREAAGASPGLAGFFERLTAIMGLVGLSALLLGGLGVAGAVRGHLAARAMSLAAMRCVGASSRVLFLTCLAQILVLAGLGIGLGLGIGAAAPFVVSPLLGEVSPVRVVASVSFGALAVAAAFGLLTTLFFSLPPLSAAGRASPLALFRGYAEPFPGRPGRAVLAVAGVCGLCIAALSVAVTGDRRLGLGFVAVAILSALILRLVGAGLRRGLALIPAPGNPILALAVSGLRRPGNASAGVVASLGLGLTVLSGMALVDANFTDLTRRELPRTAPAYFFIDIQPAQLAAFEETVRAVPGVTAVHTAPNLRGRIVTVRGMDAEQANLDPDMAWVARGDRGMTFSRVPPENSVLVAGSWWPEDYAGPPQASMDAEAAAGYGIGLGDVVTLNVLGRRFDVTVTSLRRINWLSLGINYVMVLSPGALDGLPMTYLATAHIGGGTGGEGRDRDAAGETLFRAVSEKFPNVTAVDVGETLSDITAIAEKISLAVTASALATLAAGILVLAQTLGGALAGRSREAVILKVCGATRADILGMLAAEQAMAGAAAGAAALALGAGLSALFVSGYLKVPWSFHPVPALLTIAVAAVLTVTLSLAGILRLLGGKSWPYLRNE